MTNQIQPALSPEERKLEHMRAELEALQTVLAKSELELTTLQVTLEDFERRYVRVVGATLARLDEVNARIADILALLNPQDTATARQATQARAQADASAESCCFGADVPEPPSQPVERSEDLKALYRQLAKTVHPDLTTDPTERARRTQWMAEVNAAYRDCDENRLRTLMNEWQHSPESVAGDGIGAQLIRLIRQIAQVESRIAAVAVELEQLRSTGLYTLYAKAIAAQQNGGDLLAMLAAEVEVQITQQRARLDELLDEFVQRKRTL